MIDVEGFYRQLGSEQPVGPDEQLVLPGEIRVVGTPDAWTAIFDALSPSEDKLDALFDISRTEGALVPFTTRSGAIAVRGLCPHLGDETADAVTRLRAVIQHLGVVA